MPSCTRGITEPQVVTDNSIVTSEPLEMSKFGGS